MVKRLIPLPICAILISLISTAGCTRSPALQPVASDLKPENIRILIAKEVLTSAAFAAATLVKAKIINATISAPSYTTGAFSGEKFTSYCVNAYIENTLFPLHKLVSANVDVVSVNGKPVALAGSQPDVHCRGTDFQPYPELERLSTERYKGS